MNKATFLVPAVLGVSFLAACPPPKNGGGGSSGINPSACGNINVGPASRRMNAFLVASLELDRASTELENSVVGACRKMAVELGINPMGDTRTVCNAVAAELDANLKVSVSQEKRLVTREVPGECHTEWSFGATAAAQCSAQANVDANLRCNGTCNGTCKGTCDGACAGGAGGGGAGGACNSQCNGTCNGQCDGGCNGYITGDVEAECRASVEIQSSVHTVCEPPKLVVEEQTVTIVDATKFAKAQAAIQAGLPTIRAAAKKAEIVGRAAVDWGKTAGGLVVATGDLVAELGEKSACVAGQMAGVVAAVAQIQARFSVSVEVSASISGSAGVQ